MAGNRVVSKVTMQELKYRRLAENNLRLRDDLSRPRAMVSLASINLINYCSETRDPLLPSVWGPLAKGEDAFAPVEEAACCTVQ
ncbi:hypothetical protein CcaverHIS002_0603240 [Cutaneotrichosporon cavernicola]|uniref:Guanine nucleotide-binding protein subunit gamma n=1 Tax=Cutaneotrichosporon cavernicola TaxID=279322 RepID=A0AA48QXW3_9TREE|nr:uncharacterized protein CcaverHIS019_0602710 [Cutaneotrichosporon cavernicola]BEI86037.1 hypothetical protein CcaverHIS002_0603240 [Cutaneotrichosporon cavernicola]BEI93812.1 hypothetical protein CcaverHIS019_0602710 [Cutaneotrichosporon cavernicola]BEJ01588.1 hypothetical protein CcaverHIS631_0602700 [Cutaneotrichosporon cavernicola]BEJ09355.1 hypothetical protein CcaverHIS641_0602700 [Cutaneotrichosporon cavernicola]